MHRHVAALLVVVSAGAVLVLELLSARLVAPYVGVTHEVYTASIGVALGAIAVGAALGGRAADVREGRLLIASLFVTGGALVLLARPVVLLIGPPLRGLGPLAAVILVASAIAVPVALLSAIAPVVVRMQLAGLEHAGRTVGTFSALGTIGGLVGTFVTGFVMLQALPVSIALLATGGLICVLGVWQLLVRVICDQRRLPTGWRRKAAGISTLTVFGAGLLIGIPSSCQVETAYYCARVEADPQRAGGNVLMLDDLRHAYIDQDDPTHLEFDYVRRFADAIETAYPAGEPLRTLHVGGGGFTMPRWLDATRSGSSHTVLELDPHVLQLVRAELDLGSAHNTRVREGDARISIRDEPTNSYDVVIGDAFSQTSVPWHLSTREFFQHDVRRVLRPDGLLVMNLIDFPPLNLLAAEVATLRQVFGDVTVLSTPGGARGTSGGNFVLVAGAAQPDRADLVDQVNDDHAKPAGVATERKVQSWARRGDVLTDDWAPVDQLLSPYS